MKHTKYRFILTALAAVALLVTGCEKEPQGEDEGGSSATGKMVSVTLPIGFDEAANTAPASTSSRATAAKSHEEGFSVSFGEPATAATAASTPATRTVAQALTNVWVLQFDNRGENVSTTNIGSLTAGDHLTAPTLLVCEECTIYVVANAPASGFSTSSPSTLNEFEAKMLHTTAVTDATKLPLSGKLSGVSVVDLGNGTGKLKLMNASPTVILKRIHAEVTLTVDFGVTGYMLTGAQLYNVPVGATYGWNSTKTTFPNNAIAKNFGYTDTNAAGLASLTSTTSGTKKSYKWFIGENRRGEVAGLIAQTDRNNAKAPAYSTFARVTLTNSTASVEKIYYDIYLGSGAVTNFDVMRNHTYTQTATIKGTADFQEALIDVDSRVSGVNMPIYLTDSKTDSPIAITSKSMETTQPIDWHPTSAVGGTYDIFDGKANTNTLTTNNVSYNAAKHCRNISAKYYLPAQAEIMLMLIYKDAIPSADCPTRNGNHWSSTERSDNNNYAWYATFSSGRTDHDNKSNNNYVRCVKEL